MALIEKFHVVAAEKPVASGQTISEGMVVTLNASGEVQKVAAAGEVPYGIAGDTKSTSASSMPGVGSAVINGDGDTQNFQNRASDYFDETKASGKMTVYHSGGEFATDQFVDAVSSAAIMAPLYPDVAAAATYGKLTTVNTNDNVVGYIISVAGSYPSGVPGVDINGDQALSGASGTSADGNTYIEFKLTI
jgi:hypothetical protein